MKKVLLFTMLFGAFAVSAQITHHINWGIGAGTEQFSATIDVGDTVEWTWTSPHPHTVTTETGSTETFDSGTIQGMGLTYSHTFTMEGSNPYVCLFHGSMAGTITVQAIMSLEERNLVNGFSVYPNPTADVLTINAANPIERLEIYDNTGKQVLVSNGGNTTSMVYMQNYPAGTYFVKITTGSAVKTTTVVKK